MHLTPIGDRKCCESERIAGRCRPRPTCAASPLLGPHRPSLHQGRGSRRRGGPAPCATRTHHNPPHGNIPSAHGTRLWLEACWRPTRSSNRSVFPPGMARTPILSPSRGANIATSQVARLNSMARNSVSLKPSCSALTVKSVWPLLSFSYVSESEAPIGALRPAA